MTWDTSGAFSTRLCAIPDTADSVTLSKLIYSIAYPVETANFVCYF